MAIDFPPNSQNPDQPQNGDTYSPPGLDTVYTYENGVWTGGVAAGQQFMPLGGGNFTGNVTFATDKIFLGINGNADFTGDVDIDGNLSLGSIGDVEQAIIAASGGTPNAISNGSATLNFNGQSILQSNTGYQPTLTNTYELGAPTFTWKTVYSNSLVNTTSLDNTGDIRIGGSLPASPNITLGSDGTASFDGTITANSSATDAFVAERGDASVYFKVQQANNSLLLGTSSQITLKGDDGSATFAGDITTTSLAGSGSVPVEVDPTGKLVRGSSTSNDIWIENNAQIYPTDANDSLLIGGTLPGSPNITLNANGNISLGSPGNNTVLTFENDTGLNAGITWNGANSTGIGFYDSDGAATILRINTDEVRIGTNADNDSTSNIILNTDGSANLSEYLAAGAPSTTGSGGTLLVGGTTGYNGGGVFTYKTTLDNTNATANGFFVGVSAADTSTEKTVKFAVMPSGNVYIGTDINNSTLAGANINLNADGNATFNGNVSIADPATAGILLYNTGEGLFRSDTATDTTLSVYHSSANSFRVQADGTVSVGLALNNDASNAATTFHPDGTSQFNNLVSINRTNELGGILSGKLNGVPTSTIYANGTANFVGAKAAINGDGGASFGANADGSDPTIFLNADGSATFGSDKLVIGPDGSGAFDGPVVANQFSVAGSLGIEKGGNNHAFCAFNKSSDVVLASIGLDGAAGFATGKISLNTDGSADFAGDITVGDPDTDAAKSGVAINANGALQIYTDNSLASSTNFRFYNTDYTDPVITFANDGSADFAGSVKVGNADQILANTTGLYLLDAGAAGTNNFNIRLDTNGQGIFNRRVSGTVNSIPDDAAWDMVDSNFWDAAGGTIVNPSNTTPGQTGVIFASAEITAWGTYFKFPGGDTPSVPANSVIPYYIETQNVILMGNATEAIA